MPGEEKPGPIVKNPPRFMRACGLATPSSDAIRSCREATKLERRGVFSGVWRAGWRRDNP